MTSPWLSQTSWRVCVTRDEDAGGPLSSALRGRAFVPVLCPVLTEAPPSDPAALREAAAHLDRYAWIVCASGRAVRAILAARGRPFPEGVRSAAVGMATAQALIEAGASPTPVSSHAGGAEPLWAVLKDAGPWRAKRVLVATTEGGRRMLIDQLHAAGARVDEVEAYRMTPRQPAAIAADWLTARPDAAVIASPRTGRALAAAVGSGALRALQAIVAIGPTTADALHELAVPCVVAAETSFAAAVAALDGVRAAGMPR